MGTKAPEGTMGCREAGELIGCSGATVRTMLMSGELKGVQRRVQGKRMTGWWFIDRSSVEDWLTDPKKAKARDGLKARCAEQKRRWQLHVKTRAETEAAIGAAVDNTVSPLPPFGPDEEVGPSVEAPTWEGRTVTLSEGLSGSFPRQDILPPEKLRLQAGILCDYLSAGGRAEDVAVGLRRVGGMFLALAEPTREVLT